MGSGAKRRFVLVAVSMGSGEKRRFVLTEVSMGSGAKRRFVLTEVSTGSGANLRGCFPPSTCSLGWSEQDWTGGSSDVVAAGFRIVLAIVSSGSGANLRGRLASCVASCREQALFDLIVVSMGSTAKRLGGGTMAAMVDGSFARRETVERRANGCFAHASRQTDVTSAATIPALDRTTIPGALVVR
jgi:hypothetical protein